MKNSCEMNEFVLLYIDNELDEEKKIQFEEHLKSCDCCKTELNEIMSVIELCNGIQEEDLPDNFKEELHNKLLVEKEKFDKEKKVVKLRSKYLKICSTIAAGLLLVVLLKGFIDNNYFSLGKYDKGTKSESMAAKQKDNENEVMLAGDTADEAGAVTNNYGYGIMSKSANDYSTGTENPESSRAIQAQNRQSIVAAVPDTSVSSRNSTIIVSFDAETSNMDAEADDIKKIALENNAELVSAEPLSITFSKAVGGGAGEGSESDKNKDSGDVKVLNFKVSNTHYEQFVSALDTSFGSDKVQTGPVNVIDENGRMDELNTRLIELNGKIEEAQGASEESSNPEEVDKLKEEQEDVINEIEKIQIDADYTMVSITITGK